MKIGLYFGTFNPVHNGHLAIANYMAAQTDLDEVWFVVSPQNPLKEINLLPDKMRLQLVHIAIKNHPKLKACDAEFHLAKPSYTVNTLSFLQKKYPKKKFTLIMGEDNLRSFHLWKDYNLILKRFPIYVYPRKIGKNEKKEHSFHGANAKIRLFDVKLLNISATEIREKIRKGEDVSEFLPEEVLEEIRKNNFYKS